MGLSTMFLWIMKTKKQWGAEMKITDTICSGGDIKSVFVNALSHIEHDKAYAIKIQDADTRTLIQNRKMHAMISDISKQSTWQNKRRDLNFWKRLFSAEVEEQEITTGLSGQLVVIGVSTSEQNKKWLAAMIELLYAYGAENNIFWSDPAEKALLDYPEARV